MTGSPSRALRLYFNKLLSRLWTTAFFFSFLSLSFLFPFSSVFYFPKIFILLPVFFYFLLTLYFSLSAVFLSFLLFFFIFFLSDLSHFISHF